MASENGSPIIVKNWHVFLTLACLLVSVTMAFASLRAQSEENQRRIRDIEESRPITIQQYRDGQIVIDQRLDRMEGKLDKLIERKH